MMDRPDLPLTIYDPYQLEDSDPSFDFKEDISVHSADFTVHRLLQLVQRKEIWYQRHGHRATAWDIEMASAYLQSLLYGFPSSDIVMYRRDEQLFVLDGVQRIETLRRFYANRWTKGQPFPLALRFSPSLHQQTYHSLPPMLRQRLDSRILPSQIIQFQADQFERSTTLYHVFERLNGGRTRLSPHFIRQAVFYGPLLEALAAYLDSKPTEWAYFFARALPPEMEQELLLRFLALFHRLEHYQPPMKSFINRYVVEMNHSATLSMGAQVLLVSQTLALCRQGFSPNVFRNTAGEIDTIRLETILFGLAHMVLSGQSGLVMDSSFWDRVVGQLAALWADPKYIWATTGSDLSAQPKVETRLQLARLYLYERVINTAQ
jgi:hypothetical protein